MSDKDPQAEARAIVTEHIEEYIQRRIGYYGQRRLLDLLLKKDIMLVALRGVTTAEGWLEEAFRAHESSSEETMMGNAWQAILTKLSQHAVGSGDFLVERDNTLWVLEMKTAPNTFNSASLAQTLRSLREKVRDHERVQAPGRRSVMPMVGILRGDPTDIWRRYHSSSADTRDIDQFPYKYMVGSSFIMWLTGIANPAELIEDSKERGKDIASAREQCRRRLWTELREQLDSHQIGYDIASVIRLVSIRDEAKASRGS